MDKWQSRMNISGDSVRNFGAQAWETSDPDGNTYSDMDEGSCAEQP